MLNTLSDIRFSKQLDIYDYSKSFSEQIEDYKNGIIPKYDTLVVGKTPEVFTKIGLNLLPMTYGTGHLSDILKGNVQDHDFGEANLKQIPKALESPVAIFASSTRPDSSVVAILDLSYNNKPMFAAVEIDGTGKLNGENIDSNAITTLHTRQNAANMLNKALAKESNGDVSVYYLDKNKATRFLRSSGVQFPGVMSITDGYVHSIRDSGSPVNTKLENVTKTQQFKRWFGDWENHPKAASKVVNADGTPKVVYHGTTANFTTFKPSNGALGKGIYFSDSKDFAKGYTYKDGAAVGTVMECYLDIKNPYIVKYADNYDTEALREKGYDGILHEATGMYVAFSPEQIKSATDNIGTFDKDNKDIRYSKQLNSNDFTYDALVSKPAMKIIDIKSSADTNATRADIIEKALENAKKHSVDSKSESGIYVKNTDSGTDILVGKNGLSHGLHRNYFKNAELTSHVGDFLENAILINRHNAVEQSKKGSIYLGLLRDGENLYIGRAITNDSNVLEDVEALYALSNKKESVAHNRLDSGDALRLDTDSEISIADFLNIVKDKYADVLPKNVLDSLNMERPNSSVSDSVRYSKELMTAEEKKKVREAERAAYLERQLVSTAPLGGKAKAVSPTAKAAVAKKIASGMPGVSTAQVNEQLTKFDAYNHIKSLTAI